MRCHLLAFLHVGCLQGVVVPSNINSMRTCRYLWREGGGEGRGGEGRGVKMRMTVCILLEVRTPGVVRMVRITHT